ncbi:arsenic resistance N-acetyltransferase ArsN2 [Runella sp.]|uniref:arsenic resistance N-acetyltransferase ArsN2 n=1 Tax=Runella sp. TaxID=1960881 RepID=UPI003D0B80DD
MNNEQTLKDIVREKYTEVAQQSKDQNSASCCGCGPTCGTEEDFIGIMAEDYTKLSGYVADADLGLGCGLPTQFAQIKHGDTVIDLGSGAGNDAFVARAETGAEGKVIGIDFTQAMLTKSRANAEKLGFNNVEFRQGDIEQMPVNDNVADVIVSNCVLNLVPNKANVFAEIFRVLKPGGHFSISDIVLVGELPEGLQHAAEMYAGCVAGAIQKEAYLNLIEQTGFVNITLQKDREIVLPDTILTTFLSPEEITTFRTGGTGIYSITVYAEKPAASKFYSSDGSKPSDTLAAVAEVEIRMAQASDYESVVNLLKSAGLPTEDLNPSLPDFFLAFDDEKLMGSAGVEINGTIGLLRSVAVHKDFRNYKIARRLVNDLTKSARLKGVKELYLITTTADGYFEKQGYERISRETVPIEIAHSQQFSNLCPSSAVVMKKEIEKSKIKLSDLEQVSSCCTPNSGCC